ncbi:hypothetical protein QCM77_12635 [Bradyrhizobium sp. SSUT18]|uniref:hypothetical protein n=1 Tax=Bradyrhizobium sp. SSUT18 TaxID=3040602 RepID=UPI002447EED9|nr:hypothetical protein [Bradyrhizobium sp. SSUT18]MDH2400782.1 hypothetical protein [Bradyrhizobium sp. SSUT18]
MVAINAEIGDLVAQPGGGEKRLAVLRRDKAEAREAVDELEAAYGVALRQDAQAEIAQQAAARDRQFQEFAAAAEEWTKVGVELSELIEKAAKLRVNLGTLAEDMQHKFPTGLVAHALDFKTVDVLVGGVANPIHIDALLAGEAFRSGMPNAFLPGARPPHAMLAYDRPSIEPAAIAFQRSGAYFVRLLREAFKTHTSEAA